MKKILLNPFERYAGTESVVIGIVILLVTATVAFFGKIHLDGVIDLHMSGDNIVKSVPAPTFLTCLLESTINWLSMVLFIFIAAKILSKSQVRFVDVLGTQAMARFPMLIACLASLVFSDDVIIRYFESSIKKDAVPVVLSATDIISFAIMTIITLAALVWMIMLMYKAYSVACNIKGGKSIISFIVCILLAETLSKIIINQKL